MAAGDRVLELLDGVLTTGRADPVIVSDLVREKVREGLYLEYKRGKWLTDDRKQDLRDHVSGFANAEGGVLIIGIVGGEEVQRGDKWSFESPTCPDKVAGWDAWLGHVLAEVSIKTRVAWTVVEVEGSEVVVIAANRAEELIRIYEKPKYVCYLRIGEQTLPIDETLFVDLALGRRAKPDLALEELTVRAVNDSLGFRVTSNVTVHNQGLLWVEGVTVAWSGYGRGGTRASASLQRELALRSARRSDIRPTVGTFQRRSSTGDPKEIRPFEAAKFAAEIKPPIGSSPPWAWFGAVMAVPRNGSPLWAQLAIQSAGDSISTKAWALPRGIAPVVAWFEGDDVPPSIDDFFGAGAAGSEPKR